MTTDFNYNNKTIDSGGPIKPSGTDQPGDPRTRVDFYSDIKLIPNPYVGMIITVKTDETNQNKMTDYKVLSLKANTLGIANSVIDRVQRYVDYLGVSTGGGTGEGLTDEQKTNLNKIPTIEQDVTNLKTTVGDSSSGLIKDVEDLKTNGVSQDNINSAINEYLTKNPITLDDKYKIALDWWQPPAQPDTWKVDSSSSTSANKGTSDSFINEFYEPYLSNSYDNLTITKEIIGKDESGLYDIPMYIFTPKNYTRTILLESGMHTYEYEGYYGLGRLIYYIVNEPDIHEGIKYIRDNVRLLVIPVLNPWGMNQQPHIYGNCNRININRDWGYDDYFALPETNPNTNEWTGTGEYPFSQSESRAFRDVLIKYQGEIEFVVNCHTGKGWDQDVWCYYVKEDKILQPKIKEYEEWISPIFAEERGVSISNLKNRVLDANTSYMIRYINNYLGIPACTPEMVPNRTGGDAINDSTSLTAYLRHIGNIIIHGLCSENYIEEKATLNALKVQKNRYRMSQEFSNLTGSESSNVTADYITLKTSSGTEYIIYLDESGTLNTTLANVTLASELGTISHTDGTLKDSTSTIRTNYIAIGEKTIKYEIPYGYKILARYYNDTNSFIGGSSGYLSNKANEELPDNTSRIKLLIKKADESNYEDEYPSSIKINGVNYIIDMEGSGGGTAVDTLYIDKTSVTIEVNGETQLIATYNDADVTSLVSWNSDNSNCTVSSGKITGISPGTSIITATYNNQSVTCSVKVISNEDIATTTLTAMLGGISSADGSISESTTRFHFNEYIPAPSDTTVYFECSNSYLYFLGRCYDSNKTYLGGMTMPFSSSGSVKTLPNTSYVRFMGKRGEKGTEEIVENSFTGKTFTFNGNTYNLTSSLV